MACEARRRLGVVWGHAPPSPNFWEIRYSEVNSGGFGVAFSLEMGVKF